MKAIHFYPLCGLFDEFYNPCLADLALDPLQSVAESGRLNGLFWGQLLSETRLDSVIKKLQDKYRFEQVDELKYAAVLANPALFKRRIKAAIEEIVDQATPEPLFFGAVESLSILCRLYAELEFFPYNITVADGFILNEFSSKIMLEQCMLPAYNPYLPFLTTEFFPLLERLSQADIAYIHGPIRYSTMAMAIKAKQLFPHIHISIIDHSSEYFSYTKIIRFLKQNRILFSVIDSIVLEDDYATKSLLEQALEANTPLAAVPNLLYFDKQADTIVQTEMNGKCSVSFAANLKTRRPSQLTAPESIDPSRVVDGKLYPTAICPWHQCSFCGINQKYYRQDCVEEDMAVKIKAIAELVQKGAQYFWFYDEAATPEQLAQFADALLAAKLPIIWHCRSRLDNAYDEQLCQKLAESGLREIRFGLESACPAIQQQMNKFEQFSLQTAEAVVKNFNKAGVSAHFPIIIGMPNETSVQRQETYVFLEKLKTKYPRFTFNINILELDVSSKLYTNFEDYGISGIKLTCRPEHFLGNTAEGWADDYGWFESGRLTVEQNRIMRKLLYPWMPENAITPPNILYRLSEAIRNTLIWKDHARKTPVQEPLEHHSKLVLSPWLVQVKNLAKNNKIVVVISYDLWYNRHVGLDIVAAALVNQYVDGKCVGDGIDNVISRYNLPEEARTELESFTCMMFEKGYLCNN